MLRSDAEVIVEELRRKRIIDLEAVIADTMRGTTEGRVYTLAVRGQVRYVLKLDAQREIAAFERFHRVYRHNELLPELVYADAAHAYVVYVFVPGTTHYNRGAKIDWMSRLVRGLLNLYEPCGEAEGWGRLQEPRQSWYEFTRRSLEGARETVINILPSHDYEMARSLLDDASQAGQPYLLHGDTGVHNFVFRDAQLAGVIDPSPMIGPVVYDFTYAFCSSPDDLNLETLWAAYGCFEREPEPRQRLLAMVVLQLYCRIGICARLHPQDLAGYLEAWRFWRTVVRRGEACGDGRGDE